MEEKLIKVHAEDNVAIALLDLKKGDIVYFEGQEFTILDNTKAKHKIALVDFAIDTQIFMYGVLVGKATSTIKRGGLLTTKNVQHQSKSVTGKTNATLWKAPDISSWKDRTFMGYHRSDGQVGTQNIWLFFPLVFCENRNIEKLKDVFEKELAIGKSNSQRQLLRNLIDGTSQTTTLSNTSTKRNTFDNIEVKFITHQGGCGGIRQDSQTLAKLLAGYVKNPKVAGATALSLGCQNLQMEILHSALKDLAFNLEKPVLI